MQQMVVGLWLPWVLGGRASEVSGTDAGVQVAGLLIHWPLGDFNEILDMQFSNRF